MKKILIYNLLLILLFAACSEREMVMVGDIVNPTLSSSVAGKSVVITEANLNSKFDLFNWTNSTFGFKSATPEYFLWIDLAGNNFSKAVSVGSTKLLELEVLNSKVNQLLITLGAKAGVPVNAEFKITGGIHDSLNTTSNIVTVAVTPFKVIPVFPKLYISGTNNGWNWDEKAVLFSTKSNKIYEGYIYFDNGAGWSNFKMSYQPNWNSADAIVGDPNSSGVSGTLQVGNWGGNNINVTDGPGYYKVIANINSLTSSLLKTNWAITGDFNSWGFASMTFDKTTEIWSYTGNFTVGGFKFIANSDWTKIYGDDDLDGYMEPGTNNNNIKITVAGNYTITMDLSQALYTYKIVKN